MASMAEAVEASVASQKQEIPTAQFVENVESFLAGRDADSVIRLLTEQLQQYKLVETRLLAQKRDVQLKMPDIKKSLEIVRSLLSRTGLGEETVVDFEVTEGIYAQAAVKDASSVGLWLGANVMLEYPLEEAVALLLRSAEAAESSLRTLQSDVLFLRDQINITEVTIARIFNWDVAQRRLKKQVEVPVTA